MSLTDWFLTSEERDNSATVLDRRHPSGEPWTYGNAVRPLVHGSEYFAALLESIGRMRSGDLLLFTDWRGDPDELLDGAGRQVGHVLRDAARAGVVVRGLIWRSHLDRLRFSERENRHLGEDIDAAGGVCLLDARVRIGGSHHQKFVVLRHRGRPELDVAYVGGIDLCHSRRDDVDHLGDPQRQPMAAVYGARPPWHDIQMEIRGPAVGDIEAVFRERWDDPSPLSRNPLHRIRDRVQRLDETAPKLPDQSPDPEPRGDVAVQLLRTYPYRRHGYPFAPMGERSVARGVAKAVSRARRLIYAEDQYLWSREVASKFAAALEAHPDLLLIVVIPLFPDQDGPLSEPPYSVGREAALRVLQRAGGDRVAVYGLENQASTPVYVHSKVCVIDDEWAAIGSDNLNRRSWTHDSELSVAVVDCTPDLAGKQPETSEAMRLRLELAREHLDRAPDDDSDLVEPQSAFRAFAECADALERWHADGRAGTRPPGRLRRYKAPRLSHFTKAWANPIYRLVYDPDGRPGVLRRRRAF